MFTKMTKIKIHVCVIHANAVSSLQVYHIYSASSDSVCIHLPFVLLLKVIFKQLKLPQNRSTAILGVYLLIEKFV